VRALRAAQKQGADLVLAGDEHQRKQRQRAATELTFPTGRRRGGAVDLLPTSSSSVADLEVARGHGWLNAKPVAGAVRLCLASSSSNSQVLRHHCRRCRCRRETVSEPSRVGRRARGS